MALTTEFSSKFLRKTKSLLKKYGVETAKGEYPASILAYSKIKWDFLFKLKQKDLMIIVEVELKRPDPVSNFIKTLIWVKENNNSKKHILFIQFFDHSYVTDIKSPQYDYCKKLWDMLDVGPKANFQYCPLPIKELTRLVASTRDHNKIIKDLSDKLSILVKRQYEKISDNSLN